MMTITMITTGIVTLRHMQTLSLRFFDVRTTAWRGRIPFSILTAALATCVSEEEREKEGEEEGGGGRGRGRGRERGRRERI